MLSLPLLKLPPWFMGQLGVPGSASPEGLRIAPQGVVFYVDQNHPDASDSHDGVLPDHPLLTIQEAIDKMVTGRGDVARIMPGSYDEELVVNKDYITLDGILSGYGRPDVTGLGVGPALIVHGQGFVAQHIRFAADGNFPAVVQGGNGYLYTDCVFDGDGSDCLNLLPDLDDDSYTASEGQILGNLFRGGNFGLVFTNPGPGIEGGVGPTDVLVAGNRFYGQVTSAIDDVDTPGSNDTTFLDCVIAANFFVEVGAAYVYITLDAGGNNTGLICGNWFADADVLNTQVVIPAGIQYIGNYDGTGFSAL